MTPILLRPIREQFEHDRVVRQLRTRWRRRYSVAVNPGEERSVPVRVASQPFYPDLVLTSTDRPSRLHGVVEVETAESVNHLEAVAQWAHLAKVRGAFYLYVPAGTADTARRLCEDNGIKVSEIWVYYAIGTQIRFSLAHRSDKGERAAKAQMRRGGTSGSPRARQTKKTVKTGRKVVNKGRTGTKKAKLAVTARKRAGRKEMRNLAATKRKRKK